MEFLRKKVLRQIERTYRWLEQAELAYKEGGIEDGEKNLSLASAELKLAWESSYFWRSKKEELQPAKLANHRLIASVAMILVFSLSIALAIGPLFLPTSLSTSSNRIELSEGFVLNRHKNMKNSNLNFEMLKARKEDPVGSSEDDWYWPEIKLVGNQIDDINNMFGQTRWSLPDKGGK